MRPKKEKQFMSTKYKHFNDRIWKYLGQYIAIANCTDIVLETPFINTMNTVIRGGFDINYRPKFDKDDDLRYESLLHYVLRCRPMLYESYIPHFMILSGADVNYKNRSHQNALLQASYENAFPDLVKIILERTNDIYCKDGMNKNAFERACDCYISPGASSVYSKEDYQERAFNNIKVMLDFGFDLKKDNFFEKYLDRTIYEIEELGEPEHLSVIQNLRNRIWTLQEQKKEIRKIHSCTYFYEL